MRLQKPHLSASLAHWRRGWDIEQRVASMRTSEERWSQLRSEWHSEVEELRQALVAEKATSSQLRDELKKQEAEHERRESDLRRQLLEEGATADRKIADERLAAQQCAARCHQWPQATLSLSDPI